MFYNRSRMSDDPKYLPILALNKIDPCPASFAVPALVQFSWALADSR
jgi:hypothetical protein